jgi:hypothetical protein
MAPDDIEAKVDLHIDGIGLGSVRYYHVADVTLQSNGRKVHKEARYDQNTDKIEIRATYYLDGEQVSTNDWVESGLVVDNSTVVDADNEWSGETFEGALTSYINAQFLGAPELDLGEVFDDVLKNTDA